MAWAGSLLALVADIMPESEVGVIVELSQKMSILPLISIEWMQANSKLRTCKIYCKLWPTLSEGYLDTS
jgi:hypothetical protein